MSKQTVLDQYRKCAEICSKTESGNKSSIRANNRAVKKMYKIVNAAVRQGQSAIDALSTLLDEPLSGPWLAHQLLEKATVRPEVERKCLSIIWRLATEDSREQIQQRGEQIWLKKWYEKKSSG